MGFHRAISRTAAVGIAILIIAAAVAAGYYLTLPRVKVKDTLVVGTTDSVQTTLDPAEAYDYFGVNMIQNIGEGLFAYEPGTGRLVNQLATGYTVSDGGRVWTINIRTDAKFQDGTPLSADAMKFSLERTIKMNLDPAFLIGDIIERVDVTGPNQIKITLKNSYGEEYVKALLSTWVAYAVNPKNTPCCDPQRDLLTPPKVADMIGPYKVSRWEPGQFIELTANPNYYGAPPKTPKVIIKFFKDPDSLATAIRAGDIDVAYRTLSPATVRALKADPNVQVIAGPGVAPIRYLVFNTNKSPFDNKLVRQAIAYTIDRERIVNTLFLGELARPLYSMVPIDFFGHIDAFKERYGDRPNLDKARELLRQAGYSEAKKLQVELWYTPIRYTPVEGDVATILKEGMEATGLISVTLKNAEWATYRTLFRQEQISVWLLGWFPDFLDSDNYVRPFYHSAGNGWLRVHYANPRVDQLIDQNVLQSGDTRKATLAEIQRIVAEDAPIIPLWQEGQFAIVRKNVKGIVLDYTQIFRYWLIYAEVTA